MLASTCLYSLYAWLRLFCRSTLVMRSVHGAVALPHAVTIACTSTHRRNGTWSKVLTRDPIRPDPTLSLNVQKPCQTPCHELETAFNSLIHCSTNSRRQSSGIVATYRPIKLQTILTKMKKKSDVGRRRRDVDDARQT